LKVCTDTSQVKADYPAGPYRLGVEKKSFNQGNNCMQNVKGYVCLCW